MDGEAESVRERNQNASLCRSIELRHDKPGQGNDALERFHLIDGVLPGCGIEDKQDGVMRVCIQFLDDPGDFLEFCHQASFVLETSGGVN